MVRGTGRRGAPESVIDCPHAARQRRVMCLACCRHYASTSLFQAPHGDRSRQTGYIDVHNLYVHAHSYVWHTPPGRTHVAEIQPLNCRSSARSFSPSLRSDQNMQLQRLATADSTRPCFAHAMSHISLRDSVSVFVISRSLFCNHSESRPPSVTITATLVTVPTSMALVLYWSKPSVHGVSGSLIVGQPSPAHTLSPELRSPYRGGPHSLAHVPHVQSGTQVLWPEHWSPQPASTRMPCRHAGLPKSHAQQPA